jgi:uncharacterized protein YbjT (DUF2867 family)
MAGKKIIAVVGATGAQGGGLARAILDDPSGGFAARALTRQPDKPAARELARRGAEVVACDLDDPRSIRKAFSGADAAFCVTNYWEHFSTDKEMAQARAMAEAAKAENVGHVIWSTLEDTRKWVPLSDPRMPTLMGKYKVPHFDAKGESDGFFTAAGVPTTFLLTSFYWENAIGFGMGPKKGPDGHLAIALPMADKKLPSIGVEDIGRCAYGIFRRGGELVGQTVGIAGEHLTGEAIAAGYAKALGREVVYAAVPPDVFRGLGFPGAEDLGNMFQFKCDFNDYYCGARSLAFSRSLNPRLQTFDGWLAQNIARIPIEA